MLMTGILLGVACTSAVGRLIHTLRQKDQTQPTIASFGNHTKDILYIFEVSPVYRFRYISPSLDDYIGTGTVEASYADPSTCFDRIHPDDLEILLSKLSGNCNYEEPFTQRWRTNDGTYTWFEEYTTPLYEQGELVAVQGVIRNMNAAKTKQRELEQLYRQDPLTGLLNRHTFDGLLKEMMQSVPTPLGVIALDLNDLKQINDRFGHVAGDALLQQTALCLSRCAFEAYRLGGDEFVIICRDHAEQDCLLLVDQLRSEFIKHELSVAIGFAYNPATTDLADVLRKADQAMYRDKQTTKLLV